MAISVIPCPEERRKPLPEWSQALGFGCFFTDHMFLMEYRDGTWQNPRVAPYGSLQLDPASMCLHYGQEIFEGMKVYQGADGRVLGFRSRDNFARMNRSAKRLVMPEFDMELACEGLRELVRMDRRWIPPKHGYALYIRPTMIATDAALGVRPSNEYLFFMIASPVASYYPQENDSLNAVKIYVSDKYFRAVRGGTGEAKCAGNYAASLASQWEAKKAGYAQVLWLDALERRNVEEVGTMNIFFVMNGALVTSPLNGSILPGITRDSVIRLARHQGLTVEERPVSIAEVISGVVSGSVSEVFGTGTAAVISPVSHIAFCGAEHQVGNGQAGPVARRMYADLLGIQYGQKEDPFGWITVFE